MSIIDQKRVAEALPDSVSAVGLVTLLRRWRDGMRRSRSRRMALQQLAALDDLILDDIGVARGDIAYPRRGDPGQE